jgi:hypothetical protein
MATKLVTAATACVGYFSAGFAFGNVVMNFLVPHLGIPDYINYPVVVGLGIVTAVWGVRREFQRLTLEEQRAAADLEDKNKHDEERGITIEQFKELLLRYLPALKDSLSDNVALLNNVLEDNRISRYIRERLNNLVSQGMEAIKEYLRKNPGMIGELLNDAVIVAQIRHQLGVDQSNSPNRSEPYVRCDNTPTPSHPSHYSNHSTGYESKEHAEFVLQPLSGVPYSHSSPAAITEMKHDPAAIPQLPLPPSEVPRQHSSPATLYQRLSPTGSTGKMKSQSFRRGSTHASSQSSQQMQLSAHAEGMHEGTPQTTTRHLSGVPQFHRQPSMSTVAGTQFTPFPSFGQPVSLASSNAAALASYSLLGRGRDAKSEGNIHKSSSSQQLTDDGIEISVRRSSKTILPSGGGSA